MYDVIVVGAGHAGSEAAYAAAKMGSLVLLITMDMTKVAQMSCNPAMGGIAKGQIVREIDALGGMSGIVTDESMIQFRMLNKSKGPAMWSPRAQCDRMLFSMSWRNKLESLENLSFWQDKVKCLIIEDDRVAGVETEIGAKFFAKTVILTNGTFLNGIMHIGKTKVKGGRASEPEVTGLTEQLYDIGFVTGRMKTGTPPRIDGRSIRFDQLVEQPGDQWVVPFSYLKPAFRMERSWSCYLAYTSREVHEVLAESFDDSPMFDGTIQGVGPRYCPSIESKLITFADKERHQLFVEPEGKDTVEYYLNGFSSSLPWETQLNALRKIQGFEKVRIFRPGYAIEYDYFDPTQLRQTMETKRIRNLYFAGQINGTTGYEEAGAQGIMAGINAHLKVKDKDEFILRRDQGYIGVLLDDLVTKGVDEPYRMFTSRAEYRILLRQDNADVRLTPLAHEIGLADRERIKALEIKQGAVGKTLAFIKKQSVNPDIANDSLTSLNTTQIKQKTKLSDLLGRPQVSFATLESWVPELSQLVDRESGLFRFEVCEQTEIEIKYTGYIDREKMIAQKISRLNSVVLPDDIDYYSLKSLTMEAREKLSRIRPRTIGQASRISGVSPADVAVLLVMMKR